MNSIKLKSTQSEHGFSSIDLAEDSSTLGLFAMVFNDPDGSKGNRLVQCWNEHDELVEALKEQSRYVKTFLTRDEADQETIDYYLANSRALLAKIGGEDK